MAQPVRKKIAEKHPELAEQPIYTLLIDGTNLLRISFADTKINSRGEHYGAAFQFLLQIKLMLKKKNFDYIYVVFDDEDSGILRYNLYNEYKANRDKHYGDKLCGTSEYAQEFNETMKRMRNAIFSKQKPKNVTEKTDEEKFLDENFARERDMLRTYFEELYIRCIFDSMTEGDDVISYYVQNKKPNDRVVIMSSDEDLTQLISETVCIYNPRLKKFISDKNFKEIKGFPHENVVVKKIFCGDKSDNIGNIDGLSENRLIELMPEIKTRPVTINEVIERAKEKIDERISMKKKPLKWQENIVNGVSKRHYDGDFYEINEKIIDLKKPLLTDSAKKEMDMTMYAPQDPEGRSLENLYNLMNEDDILELKDSGHFSNFFSDFKPFIDKERKRIEKIK